MSLIASRIKQLVYEAKQEIDHEHVEKLAAVLRATGKYDCNSREVAADVMAADFVLSSPDADNVEFLLGLSKEGRK